MDFGTVTFLAIAILTLAVSLWAAINGRKRKRIEYCLLEGKPMLRTNLEGLPEVKIIIDEIEMAEAWLLEFGIGNTGTEPIDAADFDGNLFVDVGESNQIVWADRHYATDENGLLQIEAKQGTLIIPPQLINAGWSSIVRILVEARGDEPELRLRGRIKGAQVSEWAETTGRNRVTRFTAYSMVAALALGAFIALAVFAKWLGVPAQLIENLLPVMMLGAVIPVGLLGPRAHRMLIPKAARPLHDMHYPR